MPIDYRSFGPNGPPVTGTPGTISGQWWKLQGDEACQSISATLTQLHDAQKQRLQQQILSAKLYGNISLLGLNGMSMSQISATKPGVKDRVSYNVVESAIDTIGAKIAKNKPRPMFLTSGGDYKLQRKAKKLNQFCDGLFYENQAYRLGQRVFLDGCVWDTAAAHVFAEHGRVKYERTLTAELYVDEVEGLYGEPRQTHRVKNVDRAVLLDAMPGRRAEINAATRHTVETGVASYVSDMVQVRESWRLPSGPKAKDGRHLLSLEGGLLTPGAEQGWGHPFFPFAFFRWKEPQYGFWGRGLCQQLQNIQLEINKLLWVIQRSFHLAGSYKVFIENTSKIVSEHLTNDIGALIRYTGTPPQYVVPQIVPPEIFQHLLTLKTAAFELAGISMLSAASQKPAGLNSGKALREYTDIESDRFTTVGKAYENFYLDLARLSIATVKDIVENEGGGYEVKVPGKKFLQTVDWKDIDLEDEQFTMQCFPVSSLPNEPAGRLETIQEYVQAGFITPRQGKRLLDFPDLDQVEGLENASEDFITEVLDRIVDEGEPYVPEPYDDLQLIHEMALEYYARGKSQKLEPERLELLRTLMTQTQALMEAAAPPAPMPALGAPQAAPEPPPQSDLIPNVPGAPPGAIQ